MRGYALIKYTDIMCTVSFVSMLYTVQELTKKSTVTIIHFILYDTKTKENGVAIIFSMYYCNIQFVTNLPELKDKLMQCLKEVINKTRAQSSTPPIFSFQ